MRRSSRRVIRLEDKFVKLVEVRPTLFPISIKIPGTVRGSEIYAHGESTLKLRPQLEVRPRFIYDLSV